MGYRFFVIPARAPLDAEAELNGFVASHALLGVERRFVEDGERSYWSFCVEYGPRRGDGRAGPGAEEMRTKVDYRERLSPEDFRLFARLRSWRKKQADEEKVAAYVVMTNEQLAGIATRRPASLTALRGIDGIGEARAARYGDAILAEVAAEAKAGKGVSHAPGGESDRTGGGLGKPAARTPEGGAGQGDAP